jgi:prolipoprotein diacylglyceryltransferase
MINITLSHEEGTFYYFLSSIAAILVGIILAGVEARKNNMSLRAFGAIVSTGIISMIVGSKLILFDHLQWSTLFQEGHLATQNAKSIVGAMIGGMIGVWAAGKWYGYKKSVLELFAVAGLVALAVQRIGCLFSGCCHGVITSSPWGITYGPETEPYLEQVQLGMISADATTSLPVLPDPVFNIIACAGFALLVKWSGSKWKANGSKFLFAVLLYLGFRFIEDFSRFYLYPENWAGLSSMQWKILLSFIPLLCLLLFREKRNLKSSLPIPGNIHLQVKASQQAMLHSVFNLVVFLLLIRWLTPDEQLLIILVMLPWTVFG